MRKYLKILIILLIMPILYSCETIKKKKKVVLKHPEKGGTLIDTKDVVGQGKKDMERRVDEGPKPVIPDIKITPKRKTLTTEKVKNYVTIPDEYKSLKQKISINFQGLDFKYVMTLMAEVGKINILVGDEVSGTVTAKINNVPWDIAFQTLLDMKTLGSDIDAPNGIIRVHSPEKLKGQETFKADRAKTLQEKLQLEESVEPILAQIFKLYYISPEEAKSTLESLFGLGGDGDDSGGGGSTQMTNISITVEGTTRSIIVRGYKKDLDIVDAVVKEIDIRTNQVLIEAFIVEANSTFTKDLGSRIAAMTKRGTAGTPGSTIITGGQGVNNNFPTVPSDITLGGNAGVVSGANQLANATSGIGIIKTFGTAALKAELVAFETLGQSKIVSQPSVFTLNNQEAKVTQGNEIPYTIVDDEGNRTTEFKEIALSLTVTPSVIGDGNVLLNILVKNDIPDTTLGTEEPAVKKSEVQTKLLISDGDIVVIGGIKIDKTENTNTNTPGVSKVPVVGNLFKNKEKVDKLDEMLIFIAPKVID